MHPHRGHGKVTLQGNFKGGGGGKWHMFPLVGVTQSGIEVIKWAGMWLRIILDDERVVHGWVFQDPGGNRNIIG